MLALGDILGFTDLVSPKSFPPCSATICLPLSVDSLAVEAAMFSFFASETALPNNPARF